MGKLSDKFSLQNEFPETSYDEWKQLTEKDLEGIPSGRLKTKTYDGIHLNFMYTQQDIQNLPQTKNKPGYKNFLRGTKTNGYLDNSWLIAQEIPYTFPKDLNKALRFDLEKGQNSINIILNSASQKFIDLNDVSEKEIEQTGIYLQNVDDLLKVFEKIDITKYPLFVKTGYSNLNFLLLFTGYARKKAIDLNKISGAFEADPYDFAITQGVLPISFKSVFDEMANVTKWINKNIPNLKTIGVSGLHYHNSGANAVQELAFSFATAVDYIRQMLERGLKIDEVATKIRFTFGIGSLYFLEVAKFRAARILWAKIIEAFKGNEESQKINIHAHTSFYNQTVFDPYVNMLRTTTEAFSAVIGGVDSLHTNFFDEAIRTPDNFSRRIARNTQIILSEESHMNQIIDPAGGSYYVESLTNEVATMTWKMFREIENKGGMFKALEEGYPQDLTENSANEKKTNFNKRKDVLVGTNSYANIKENKLETDSADIKIKLLNSTKEFRENRNKDEFKNALIEFQNTNNFDELIEKGTNAVLKSATIGELFNAKRGNDRSKISIKTLKVHRIAESFEELRNASVEYKHKKGHLPKVFLLPMGPLSQNKARADFSKSFFEIGGFDVILKQRFQTVEEAIDTAIKSESKIFVICSTDETYPELVPPITKGIKGKRKDVLIVLAGYPKNIIEQLKKDGIDEFIYLGADVYQTLKNIMIKTGVIK
jgi:methylmalonyl-CoA mutase